MKNKLLPQKLKELRKVNNYTQDYVAEVLGVVRQTYSHYETGKRTPDAEAFYKLAGLYNISVDDLLHLTIDIDREESYDAPAPTQASSDLSEFLEFFNDPSNKKKYMFNTNLICTPFTGHPVKGVFLCVTVTNSNERQSNYTGKGNGLNHQQTSQT